MTGQVQFDSCDYAGARTAVDLVNGLAVEHAFGRTVDRHDPRAIIDPILSGDPTWPRQRKDDVSGLVALAARLRAVFDDLDGGDVDGAARRLNDLLAAHPAHPYLAKEGRVWRLHHHPADADLVPMATAICAEALAGSSAPAPPIGSGRVERTSASGSSSTAPRTAAAASARRPARTG